MPKSFFLLLLFAFLTYCRAASIEFTNYVRKFGKVYDTAEEAALREIIFHENLAKIQEHQRLPRVGEEALVLGLTAMSDRRPSEVLRPFPRERDEQHLLGPDYAMPEQDVGPLPTSFDWRTHGVVTPVNNELQCGSVWAFGVVEVFESVCAIAGWPLTAMSTQQVMDCNSAYENCNGGWPTVAYDYIIGNQGLQPLSTYPYTGEAGKCVAQQHLNTPCLPIGWLNVSTDEHLMQAFVFHRSPIEVAVNAANWMNYKGGVITATFCGKMEPDHTVLIVGWTQIGNTPAWIVRNVWGTTWGDQGYGYVEMFVNACDIAELPTAICVESKSGTTGDIVC